MKKRLKHYILRYTQLILKRDVRIFIVCLAVSAFFWVVLELSDSFTNNVEITVIYDKFPEGFILVNKPDTTFNVHIESIGFELLNLTLNDDNNFVIDLNKLKPSRREDGFYYVKLPTSVFENQLQRQFGSGVTGKLTSPDSLIFVFDELISKDLAVKPTYSITFAEGYRLFGKPLLNPDSVEVRGSKKALEKRMFIETKFNKFSQLSKNKEISTDLKIPAGINWVSNKKVGIKFLVAQYTQATTSIPIHYRSQIQNVRIKTFPNTVEINYLIPVKYFKQISDTMFRAEVYLDSLSYKQQNKLIPVLVKKPYWVENVRFNTEVIDYIILK